MIIKVLLLLEENLDACPKQVNVSPVFHGVSLLGEPGKVCAVSTFRFSSISSDESGMSLTVRGEPQEVVAVMFAVFKEGSLRCVDKTAIIQPSGTAQLKCIPSDH